MMRILTPFNHEEYIPRLTDAGASEFYMGFTDPGWQERFGEYSDINRLTLFKGTANRYTLKDVGRITEKLHEKDAKIYITLNAPGYSEDQKQYIERYFEYLTDAGTDGVIISDPSLIGMAASFGLNTAASTMCGIFNSDIAAFYRDKGISRIILPREVTTDEVRRIMNDVSGPEYEVFLMRNGCRYSDANCLALHGGRSGALCGCLRSGQVRIYSRICMTGAGSGLGDLYETHYRFCKNYHIFSCGQCALWRFLKTGVAAVKIVGRMDDTEEIIRDVRLTSENIGIAEECGTEREYLERMRVPGDRDTYCMNGMSCYYPEVYWRRL